ncbi:hypothetical protein LGK95_04175 [Clostridium algoriphilum]|uniref:hypothetical protein n=1 Tax=Clostridium algoriphilum TaxID=198347 RepID=UPI001CF256EB|nr:hypothetical protein [Clostridium algoriphilum]MCB2292732.1 hypothetical protein [Clostridium algoriphilum]
MNLKEEKNHSLGKVVEKIYKSYKNGRPVGGPFLVVIHRNRMINLRGMGQKILKEVN